MNDNILEDHILETLLTSKGKIRREVWPGMVEYWMFPSSSTALVGATRVLAQQGISKNRIHFWGISDYEAVEQTTIVKALFHDDSLKDLSAQASVIIFNHLEKRYWQNRKPRNYR